MTTYSYKPKEHPVACPFGFGPVSRVGSFLFTTFSNGSHLLCMRNLPSVQAALRLAASSLTVANACTWTCFDEYLARRDSRLMVIGFDSSYAHGGGHPSD